MCLQWNNSFVVQYCTAKTRQAHLLLFSSTNLFITRYLDCAVALFLFSICKYTYTYIISQSFDVN